MSIVFTDFSFKFHSQEKPTLKNINLRIEKGEKVLIIGPSGSGKSTLGQCLNGLIPHAVKGVSIGSLTIHGKNVENHEMHHYSEQIGTVLQDTDDQFVGLSIAEDIAFALENQQISNVEMYPLVSATAKMLELENMLDASPQELSGGQKQRVSLAGILVDDVNILLFDEPLAALDPKTSRKTIEIIEGLHQKTGKTIVIIEHRLEEVLHRSVDRIILMNEGCIVADTSPSHLLRSSLLKEYGIREPLYLSALKAANCELNSNLDFSSLRNIPTDFYQSAFLNWNADKKDNASNATEQKLLSIKNITYSYDGKKNALENVSFDIFQREFVSILGKNGSGKSTLTKLLIGALQPDEGKMLLENKSLADLSIFQRCQKIGLVTQNPNHMISHHMIFDEVAFGLRNRGVDEESIQTKVASILEFCGLSKVRHWPVEALSYGQKKRVTIASILVLEPQILILDEPTAGQDYRNYSAMLSFIKELNEKLGITVIIISHDMHLILEYTQRSLVFADSKLICDAPMSEIFSDKALLEKANLCPTSLFELADSLNMDAQGFIQYFINLDLLPKSTCDVVTNH